MITLLAHLTPTGFGPWGDGMARLFLEPTELLLVIALVLLAVQSGRPSADRLPLLLPLAWLLGGLIGLQLPAELLQAMACTAVVAAAGLLVARGVLLRPRVLLPLVALLAAAFALVAGSALAGHSGALEALLGGDRRHRRLNHPAHPAAGSAPSPLAGHRRAGGRQLDHGRIPADARLAGAPSAVVPQRLRSHRMETTVPAGHSLEAMRKVRWGAGSSCAESGAVPQL